MIYILMISILLIIVLFFIIISKARAKPSITIPVVNFNLPSILTQYNVSIRQASSTYQVPEYLIRAIIMTESSGIKTAIGKIGERGLMQIMQIALIDVNNRYKLGYNYEDMYDPHKNIVTGTAYLRLLKDRHFQLDSDWLRTLQSYNAGYTAYMRNKSLGLTYANKILTLYNHYLKG